MRIGLSKTEIDSVIHFKYHPQITFFLNNIDYSRESCGAILGYISKENIAIIERIEVLTNYASDKSSFHLNINELHSLEPKNNERVLGIFHNHIYNYDASLSNIDRFFQSLYPFIWFVSVKDIQGVIKTEVCTHRNILLPNN